MRGIGTMAKARFKGKDRQGRNRYELRVWNAREQRQTSIIVRARSQREADQMLAAYATDVARGEYDRGSSEEPTAEVVTVAQLMRQYIDWKRPDLAPNTIKTYEKMATAYVDNTTFGRMDAAKVTVLDVEQFGRRITEKIGASTANKLHWILSGTFKLGLKWQLLPTNPVASADAPRLPKSKARPPTPDELARIIATASDDTRPFIVFTATTGARRGEVCALRWRDVDLDAGTVTIRHSLDESGNLKETKKANVRVIPLDAYTVEVVRQQRVKAAERLLASGKRLGADTPVFGIPDAPERHYTPHAMGRAVTRVVKRAGLKGLSQHSLRHFVGTQMISGGIDPKTAADRLGHSSPITTLRRYTASTGENDRKAADVVSAVLRKAVGEGTP